MMIPASTRPWTERVESGWASSRFASSEENPVIAASSTARRASNAVSSSAAAVPSIAARLLRPRPCVSVIVASSTARAPTSAVASGGRPSSSAGRMKRTTTASATASPTSERTPCQRPSTTTNSAKTIASASSGRPRSKSTNASGCTSDVGEGSSGASELRLTRIRSPGSIAGATAPPGIARNDRAPASVPSVMTSSARRHPWPAYRSQPSAVTRTISAPCASPGVTGPGRTTSPPGHSSTMAASTAIASSQTATAAAEPARLRSRWSTAGTSTAVTRIPLR